jgi:hypothetical protein
MYASRLQVFYLLFHFRYHKPETSKEESKTDGKFTFTGEGSQATVEMVDQSCKGFIVLQSSIELDAFFRISDVFNGQFRTKSYTGLIHHFYSSLAPFTGESELSICLTFLYYFILGTINLRPVKRKVRQMESSLSPVKGAKLL